MSQTSLKWLRTYSSTGNSTQFFVIIFIKKNLRNVYVQFSVRQEEPVCSSACIVTDLSSVPEWGKSPGEGSGNPLQYSCHGQRSPVDFSPRVGHNWATNTHSHWRYHNIVNQVSLSESCSVVSNSLWPHGLYSPRNSPGQNTAVGSGLSFLQGTFPTQGSNPGLPHYRWFLYPWAIRETNSTPIQILKILTGRYITC